MINPLLNVSIGARLAVVIMTVVLGGALWFDYVEKIALVAEAEQRATEHWQAITECLKGGGLILDGVQVECFRVTNGGEYGNASPNSPKYKRIWEWEHKRIRIFQDLRNSRPF